MELSAQLDFALRSKGSYEGRSRSWNKFISAKFEDLKYGLGIRTIVTSILPENPEDMILGSVKINISKDSTKDIDEKSISKFVKLLKFKDFFEDESINYSIKQDLISGLKFDPEKFDLLHSALSEIYVLYIPEKLDLNSIIKDLIIDVEFSGHSFNEMIVYMGKGSRANILLRKTHVGKKITSEYASEINSSEVTIASSISSDNIKIILSQDSHLQLTNFRLFKNDDFIYSRSYAELASNAHLIWNNIDSDAKLVLSKQNVFLKGNGSTSKMVNVTFGKHSKYDYYNESEHIGTNTESLITGRTILHESTTINRGMVKIGVDASFSNGYQKSDFLMLDNLSRAISIPNLEIHNEQVKCTHGSSITKPDNEKMFYLMSRGLDRVSSEKLMIHGFIESALKDLNDDIRSDIINELLGKNMPANEQ